MIKKPFHRIALTGRAGTPGVSQTLLELEKHLKTLNYPIVLAPPAAEILTDSNLPTIQPSELHQHADLLIVVGGDGSLLSAAHMAIDQNLPVLGINRGRLGFLTDIHPNKLTQIDAILDGHYEEEKRFLLETGQTDHNVALNDVVLLPGDAAQMIEFDIHINDKLVCNQRADGMIVATPTGSTAYALSGGGPILHPTLEAIVLVPMFPHTLSSRPIVVTADSTISLQISSDQGAGAYVSCDGLNRVALLPGETVTINRKKETLTLIHPIDYSYYRTLREKLHWEKRAKRESDEHTPQG